MTFKCLMGNYQNISTSFEIIPGYNDMYKINDSGVVISFQRKKTRTLMPQLSCKGYFKVKLTKSGVCKTLSVHRLVLLTFVGPSNLWCNHKDGNKTNNHTSNLEYVTAQQNVIHSFEVLKVKRARGEKASKAKLTEKQVLEIRAAYVPYKMSSPKLAKKYGVSHPTIQAIINRESWKHI